MHKYVMTREFPLDSAHLLSNDDDILGNLILYTLWFCVLKPRHNLHNQQWGYFFTKEAFCYA